MGWKSGVRILERKRKRERGEGEGDERIYSENGVKVERGPLVVAGLLYVSVEKKKVARRGGEEAVRLFGRCVRVSRVNARLGEKVGNQLIRRQAVAAYFYPTTTFHFVSTMMSGKLRDTKRSHAA